MLEMKYKAERLCYILDKGNYESFNYAIVSYGYHPCCYVFLPKGHKYYGKSYENIDIECHGGLTYASEDLSFNPLLNDEWVIGWDYAHCDDYVGYYELDVLKKYDYSDYKKWTTQELVNDVHNVIRQLKNENLERKKV